MRNWIWSLDERNYFEKVYVYLPVWHLGVRARFLRGLCPRRKWVVLFRQ